MTTTMSITQALSELKLLDKRLESALEGVSWATVKTKTKVVDTVEFGKKARSQIQSYRDLLSRRQAIKSAIVLKNALTRVKVGTWEGSVAEAIEYKRSVEFKKRLLVKMREQLTYARTMFESEQQQVQRRLDALLSSELGKDVRTNPETIASLTNSFQETNKVELIDPLGLAETIQVLEEEIDTFETNIDWVLSEANGKTTIEV